MVPQDIFAVALLTLLGLVLGGGVLIVILVQRHMRSRRKLLATEEEQAELAQEFSYFGIAPTIHCTFVVLRVGSRFAVAIHSQCRRLFGSISPVHVLGRKVFSPHAKFSSRRLSMAGR